MKHLELAEKYYLEYGKPMIERDFPQLIGRYAAGLVGEGSGCLGFDDDISQDHDFGPGFCLWLTDEDFNMYGEQLQAAYDNLPHEFEGCSRENIIDGSRLGVMRIGDFYASFTGCSGQPTSLMDWFLISENNLRCVTSGKVFYDGLGEFSAIRAAYEAFYPEDVLLKKIAARMAVASQAGQYNYSRCLKRGDTVAASLALSRFIEAVVSLVHLLKKAPMPFYKWSFRSLRELAGCGEAGSKDGHNLKTLVSLIENITARPLTKEIFPQIEEICAILLRMLSSEGYITLHPQTSNFMQDYIPEVMNRITDSQLKSMHPMADCL